LFGLVWLVFWIPIYRRPEEHPRVSPAELAYIHSDPPETTAKVRWATLVTYPQAWAFMIGKFMTDPLWWFYMTWFPSFLHKQYGLDLMHLAMPLFIVYAMASIGGVVGGWLSSTLIRAGWSLNASRKTALFVCALAVVPVIFASHVSSVWTSVFLMGLCTAAHQGFSSNLYTLVSDMFPKQATASVAGLGGTFGYVGASLFSALTGLIVGRWTHQNYGVVFLVAGLGYLVAFAIIQILAPKLEPVAWRRHDLFALLS
jgi:ACS family hexuronate transporter-like MFS transporter